MMIKNNDEKKNLLCFFFLASSFICLRLFSLLLISEYSGLLLSLLHQLPAQMGSLLGSSLALQYLNCVQDESAVLRFNFWLGYALHEGEEKPLKLVLPYPMSKKMRPKNSEDLGLNPDRLPSWHFKGLLSKSG